MSVKIRLRRMGAHKKPFYRIVIADSRSPRDGKFIEQVGYFNPIREPNELKMDITKIDKWISNGAKPTDTVKALIKKFREGSIGTDGTKKTTSIDSNNEVKSDEIKVGDEK